MPCSYSNMMTMLCVCSSLASCLEVVDWYKAGFIRGSTKWSCFHDWYISKIQPMNRSKHWSYNIHLTSRICTASRLLHCTGRLFEPFFNALHSSIFLLEHGSNSKRLTDFAKLLCCRHFGDAIGQRMLDGEYLASLGIVRLGRLADLYAGRLHITSKRSLRDMLRNKLQFLFAFF